MPICADDVRESMPLFRSGCGGSSPTSALQLIIRECSIPRAQQLNALWHSVLPRTSLFNLQGSGSNVNYWADYQDRAYAVAIWTRPIAANRMKDGDICLELRRLAIADDAPLNTASRMLAVMRRLISKKFPHIVRLVSYQAEEHHCGTIYRASGWQVTGRYDGADRAWRVGDQKEKLNLPMQTTSAKIRWEYPLQ